MIFLYFSLDKTKVVSVEIMMILRWEGVNVLEIE